MAKIRVLLADDHAVLRAGLKLLVNHQPDMEVVAEAGDFSAAVRLARSSLPDVITLDLTMPGGNGIGKIGQVCDACPTAKVLVLTMHDDPAYLRAALGAGARGYVVKKAADTELLGAIRAVHAGRVFVDLESHVAHAGGTAKAGTKPAYGQATPALSKREQTVLERLAEGHTNQSIADELELSVKTVESYRARLLRKLNLRTRADITRYAVEQGILGPSASRPARQRV